MKENDKLLIEKITKIREDNNKLWMKIVELALTASPTMTKQTLKSIKKNDEIISKTMSELTNE